MKAEYRIKNIVFLKPNERQKPFVGVELYPRQIIVEDTKNHREIVIHPSDKVFVEKKGIILSFSWYLHKSCKYHPLNQTKLTCLLCGETFCCSKCFSKKEHFENHLKIGRIYPDVRIMEDDREYKEKPVSRRMVYVPNVRDVGKQLVLKVTISKDDKKDIEFIDLFSNFPMPMRFGDDSKRTTSSNNPMVKAQSKDSLWMVVKTCKVDNFPTGNFDFNKETFRQNLNTEFNKKYFSNIPKYVEVNQELISKVTSSKSKKLKYFTIMNYNVLADIYSSSQVFPTTDASFLDWDFRKRNLLREVLSHNADIVCLQEVQNVHFEKFLLPELKKRGYDGVYKKKTKKVYSRGVYTIDGCATFWKVKKFEFVRKHEVEFRELAIKELKTHQENEKEKENNINRFSFLTNNTSFSTSNYGGGGGDFFNNTGDSVNHTSLFSENNFVKKSTISPDFRRLMKDNISLCVVLKFIKGDKNKHKRRRKLSKMSKSFFENYYDQEYKGNSYRLHHRTDDFVFEDNDPAPLLLVGNVHIMANVKYKDVKLWQIASYMRELEKLTEGGKLPMVIGGDFNSTPQSASYKLIVDGVLNKEEIRSSFNESIVNTLFPNDKDRISHSLNLLSSYSQYQKRKTQKLSSGTKGMSSNSNVIGKREVVNETVEYIDYRTQQNIQNKKVEEPPFTNKCYTFSGTLDYIFHQKDDFLLTKVLKIPELDGEYLPNSYHSSDHVPLVSEFIIKNKSKKNY